MSFLLQLWADMSHRIVSATNGVGTAEALFQSTLMTSVMFDEISQSESLAVFATVGGLGERVQKFARGQLMDAMMAHQDQVISSAYARYAGLSSITLQPYIAATSFPNIIAPLHLSCQSLCADYVFSPDSNKLMCSRT
jgi:hypothetical protein